MRLEKIDLLEWGWHKTGDPSKPKGGFLWVNPDYPDFYIMYDELEGCAYVLYRYAKGGSEAYNTIVEIYRFMDINKEYIHKGYEHEQDFGL